MISPEHFTDEIQDMDLLELRPPWGEWIEFKKLLFETLTLYGILHNKGVRLFFAE